MQGGKRIHDQIDEAIRVSDRLLLLLSSESMASSWVKTEIGKARQKERAQKHTVVFPIGLTPFADIRAWQQFDADVGEEVAKAIREFYVPDFSTWRTDDDAYQREFTRL
jgi:TIR domain-containing protein